MSHEERDCLLSLLVRRSRRAGSSGTYDKAAASDEQHAKTPINHVTRELDRLYSVIKSRVIEGSRDLIQQDIGETTDPFYGQRNAIHW